MIAIRHSAIGPDTRISLSKAARILGVSPKSMARWARVGVRGVVLPVVKIGGRVYVLKAELDAFIGASNSCPAEQGDKRALEPRAGRRLAASEAVCDRAGI